MFPSVFPIYDLTILENIMLYAGIYGVPKALCKSARSG